MRFVVYGAGAIGGVVGGRLAEAGHEVVLIARGEHHDAIRDEGLRLVAPDAEPLTLSIPVVSHPAGIDFRDDDVVLLAMKSQHTGKALSALLAAAPATVSVVCLQNGVANEPAALRLFEDVYGVCVVCPALHVEAGVVEAHAAPVTGILDIGRFPYGVGPRGEKIAAAFASATFESVPRGDIMRWKYGKLLNNLGNAVDALCGPDPDARVVQTRAWTEGAAVLAAASIAAVGPDEDAARRGDGFQWGGDAARSRPGGSSWQSLERGTGSIEADYLNGEIVLLGRLFGVPTPVNLLLQQLAASAAREGQKPGTLPADELIQMMLRVPNETLSAHRGEVGTVRGGVMDEAATMRRVIALTGAVVDNIEPEQLDHPSPCAAWTVRDVLNHITAGAEMFAICVRDGEVSDEQLGEIMTGDRLGDDYKASFHRATDDANAAFALPGAMHRIVKLPFGEMPASMAANIAIFDVTTHAWDLAKATGQSTDLDPEVVTIVYRVAQTMLTDDWRNSGMFGQEVAITDDAPVADRLAALAGRTP